MAADKVSPGHNHSRIGKTDRLTDRNKPADSTLYWVSFPPVRTVSTQVSARVCENFAYPLARSQMSAKIEDEWLVIGGQGTVTRRQWSVSSGRSGKQWPIRDRPAITGR